MGPCVRGPYRGASPHARWWVWGPSFMPSREKEIKISFEKIYKAFFLSSLQIIKKCHVGRFRPYTLEGCIMAKKWYSNSACGSCRLFFVHTDALFKSMNAYSSLFDFSAFWIGSIQFLCIPSPCWGKLNRWQKKVWAKTVQTPLFEKGRPMKKKSASFLWNNEFPFERDGQPRSNLEWRKVCFLSIETNQGCWGFSGMITASDPSVAVWPLHVAFRARIQHSSTSFLVLFDRYDLHLAPSKIWRWIVCVDFEKEGSF
jgi:hypothetical protein